MIILRNWRIFKEIERDILQEICLVKYKECTSVLSRLLSNTSPPTLSLLSFLSYHALPSPSLLLSPYLSLLLSSSYILSYFLFDLFLPFFISRFIFVLSSCNVFLLSCELCLFCLIFLVSHFWLNFPPAGDQFPEAGDQFPLPPPPNSVRGAPSSALMSSLQHPEHRHLLGFLPKKTFRGTK